MNPVFTGCNALRARGVTGPALGTLSTVKPCGGTLSQSSKSSGARRFWPTEEDDELANGGSACGTDGGARLGSGVRVLKTDSCGVLLSGVFGLDGTDGPETARVCVFGVVGIGTGIRGARGAADFVDLDEARLILDAREAGLEEESALGS